MMLLHHGPYWVYGEIEPKAGLIAVGREGHGVGAPSRGERGISRRRAGELSGNDHAVASGWNRDDGRDGEPAGLVNRDGVVGIRRDVAHRAEVHRERLSGLDHFGGQLDERWAGHESRLLQSTLRNKGKTKHSGT